MKLLPLLRRLPLEILGVGLLPARRRADRPECEFAKMQSTSFNVMRFSQEVLPYINGDLFSSGLKVPISIPESNIPVRNDVLGELAKRKRVVHLGCCDHLPLIDGKIAKGIWLHGLLTKVASECFGVDLNAEAVEYCQTRHEITNITCANILEDEVPEIAQTKWDYLVLGEILEHTDDPVGFLGKLRDRFRSNVAKLVITVPNALRDLNCRMVRSHLEFINTDHRFWFTPYTLAKIASRAGMECDWFIFCEHDGFRSPRYAYLRPSVLFGMRRLRRYPAFRSTLLMVLNV